MPTRLTLMPLDHFISSLYIADMSQQDLTAKAEAMKTALKNYCKWIQRNTDPTATCKPPKPIAPPKPSPVPDNAVRSICIKNSGAYVMWFEVNDLTTQFPITVASKKYAVGSTVCVSVPSGSANRLDVLRCRVHKVLGSTKECPGQTLVYDNRARRQAHYKCTGTTLIGKCVFVGFKNYAADTSVFDANQTDMSVSDANQTVWV